jgi:FAD:protein FMN transferase
MRRRRFLKIAAAALAWPPGQAVAETLWQGTALGAEVSLLLRGAPGAAKAAIAGTLDILRRMEAEFSLFDPASSLSRLNRAGTLAASADFRALCAASGAVHRLSKGYFDPTVQSLWQARASGRDEGAARASIGWEKVSAGAVVRLLPGQEITFNGIAQGYATDRVKAFLARCGFGPALIDIGEFAALGGPFDIGISDPDFGLLGRRHLTDSAIATSSPAAMTLASGSHILNPFGGAALWSTVSVEAETATLADGLSTALVFMDSASISTLFSDTPALRSVTLISPDGDLSTLTA